MLRARDRGAKGRSERPARDCRPAGRRDRAGVRRRRVVSRSRHSISQSRSMTRFRSSGSPSGSAKRNSARGTSGGTSEVSASGTLPIAWSRRSSTSPPKRKCRLARGLLARCATRSMPTSCSEATVAVGARSAATGRLAIASEARPGETIVFVAVARDRPGASRRVGDRGLGGRSRAVKPLAAVLDAARLRPGRDAPTRRRR